MNEQLPELPTTWSSDRTQDLDGVAIVTPNQAAVDLITGPGRNPAEAAALIGWMERMSRNGANEMLAQVRSALPDALTAVRENGDSVIEIGAQAIYVRTRKATVVIARRDPGPRSRDRPANPQRDPLIEAAMTTARFVLDPTSNQPDAWISPSGTPVDLMVPDSTAGDGERRSAHVPPYGKRSLRSAAGLEAAVVWTPPRWTSCPCPRTTVAD